QSPTTLYAISDSAYAEARIYTIDTSTVPARFTGYVTLTFDGAPKAYDLEGIALRAEGGFWAAAEGGADTDNLLLAVAEDGTVPEEIRRAADVEAAATTNGFEGVAAYLVDGAERVVVAQQRPWADDADNHVKLDIYDPATGAWTFVAYELDA